MFFMDGIAALSPGVVIPDHATAAADSAVAMTLTAEAGKRHYLIMCAWSYSDAPTGGRLTVSGLDNSETLDFDIINGGPGVMLLPPIPGKVNTNMVITLAAGGAGVVGKLNIFTRPINANQV